MRIYWYWPFARPEELPLAYATARRGDELAVHVIDRDAAPATSTCSRVRLRRDLPEVRRDATRAWLPSRTATYLRRAELREQALRTEHPDVCHVHYVNRFTDWVLPRKHDARLVVSVHDVVPHNSRLPDRAEHALLAATYRRADALVVHHDSLQRRLQDEFAVDAPVYVVPHQVFAYEDAEPLPLPDRPCVLFLGSLRDNKGVHVLLEALGSTSAGLRVVVAGRGERHIESALRQAAQDDPRLQVEIGYVSQHRKVELFREATVVVLPYTEFASQSGVLHDAYAHGRPVIVTDVGALGDTVREDGTGIVIPPADPAALATAIGQTIGHRTTLELHAANAQALREERSPQRVGTMLRAVYDGVTA